MSPAETSFIRCTKKPVPGGTGSDQQREPLGQSPQSVSVDLDARIEESIDSRDPGRIR
jgi:hypothetical protein